MKAEIYRTEQSADILKDFCNSVMESWSFHHKVSMVQTRHGETHVVTAGDRSRPALVLLHGAASNILGWGAAIPEYMDDFFVIAPDIPGEAGKSAPKRPSWDNDDYIQWLDEVLAALCVRRAALLGLSFGGWAAMKYAAARPHSVARLAALAPGGIAQARTSTVLKTIVYSMQGPKGAAKMKHLVFGKGEIHPMVSRFFDLLQEHYAPRFGSPPLLSDGEIRRIACPVLMMAGSEDAFFDARKAGARLGRLLPGAQILIDTGGKHGITLYGGKIHQFLAQAGIE